MYTLNSEKRNIFGKKLKREREKGLIPAILYGSNTQNEPIFVSLKEFQKLFKKAGESTVVELILENQKKKVLISEVKSDPITGNPIHADFLAVNMAEPIEAVVNLVFEGESETVKMGNILVKVIRELTVKALPADLPHEIIIDISALKTIEDKILIKDLKLGKSVFILDKELDEVVALIEVPKEGAEETPSEIKFEEIEATKEKEKKEGKEEEK